MKECGEKFERVCRGEFEAIHAKLDRLDEAIRGNGRPGIQVRLDRLEAADRSRAKLIWIIVGGAATLAVSQTWTRIFGG